MKGDVGMIICPKCGTENPNRNTRCKKCLSKIRDWTKFEKILGVCTFFLLGVALVSLLLQPTLTQQQLKRQRAQDEIEIKKEYQTRIRREAQEQKTVSSASTMETPSEYRPTASGSHSTYNTLKAEDLPDYVDDNFRAWLKTFHKRTESSRGRIRGRVINDSAKTFGYVAIKFSLYDSAGNLIGSTLTNMNDLGSGKTWQYEAVVLQDKAESAEISGITAF